MKKGSILSNGKRVVIENPSGRTLEQQAFDEMVGASSSDAKNSRVIDTANSVDDWRVSSEFVRKVHSDNVVRMVLIAILGVIAAAGLAVLIWVGISIEEKNNEGKISVNYSAEDLEGENYEDVISILESRGFTNIKTQTIDDLIVGLFTKDGEVEEVRIDGSTIFSSGSKFYPDTEIVVVYHTFSD